MNKTILIELEHNRKRLEYYSQLRTKTVLRSKSGNPMDKWVEIYAERVRKLERQADKLGLRVQLDAIRKNIPIAQA